MRFSIDRLRVANLVREPRLARLLEVLNGGGEETRVVGGAVRNALIGRPVSDVDLATTALPEETERRAKAAGFKVVPTGIEHGTLTLIVAGEPFEVTSLREDIETDGRRARVRFGRDFAADARRRDFTMNALSATAEGAIVDDVGGLPDLEARRVRFIGEASERIREDYLRILRFFRFSAEYGEGPLDPEGLDACTRLRDGLAILSRERIGAEFLKLVAARRAVEICGVLSERGLLAAFLGGVGECGRLERAVLAETTLEERAPDRVRRLCALAVLKEEDAVRLADRLRLPNRDGARMEAYARTLAALKSLDRPVDARRVRCLAAQHGVPAVADALAAVTGEPRPIFLADAHPALLRFARGEDKVPVLPLRGADLLEAGLASGPAVGRALALAREAWLADGCREGAAERERLIALVLAETPPCFTGPTP